MKKILIMLQFYDGDRQLAMGQARLISDLQVGHSQDADFMFVSRFDCKVDRRDVIYVAKKFNTMTHVSRRHATGWPHGPNEMWFDAMTRVAEMVEAQKWPQYEAILTLEADDVPLQKNWIHKLRHAWDAQQKAKEVCCMGALLNAPNAHINGNALWSGRMRFLKWVQNKASCNPTQGWDYALAPQFAKFGWADTALIRSYWQRPTLTETDVSQLQATGCVLFHGCKDMSAQQIVRKKLLGQR
jgi:hypothetical protein